MHVSLFIDFVCLVFCVKKENEQIQESLREDSIDNTK